MKRIIYIAALLCPAFTYAQKDTTLKEVEIISSRENQTITTLTATDLNKASGLNLQDALNNLPGVTMQSRTPWGGQHIIIRGYYPSTDNGRSNSENFGGLGYQLYINNIPVTDATGTTTMDDIDYSTLGKVEVIKGPSPLYGSYIAGAVNLFTPTVPANETSLQETSIAGSNGLFRTNTTFMSSDGHSDVLLNYGHQTYDGFRPNDGSTKDFASFAGSWHTSGKNTFSSYFSYNHSYEELAGELDSFQFYGRQPVSDTNYMFNSSHADIQSYRGGVTDKYQINDHFSDETTIFLTGLKLNQAFAHGYTQNENLSFGVRSSLNYQNNGNKLSTNATVLGVSFERTDQNTQGNFVPPPALGPFNQNTPKISYTDAQNYALNYSVFSQWTFRLAAPQLSLTVGGSLNFVEFGTQNLVDAAKQVLIADPILMRAYTPVFTPDATLKKVFNKNLTAYASTAMGYCPPTISQMTSSNGQVNTSLKPESAIQYEIGAMGHVGKENGLEYQASVFDLDISNRLTPETSNGVTSVVNVGEQRNIGAEVSLSYNLIKDNSKPISLLRPWVTYTYMDATYVSFGQHAASKSGADTVVANFDNNKVAGIAPNIFNVGIDLSTKYGFYLFTMFQYMDKAPVTFDNASYMKAYDLLRLKVGYKKQITTRWSVDVFAGGDNLLGSTYYSLLFVGQNMQELAQGNDPYIKKGGGDGYILPGPYNSTFYGGFSLKCKL